MARPKIELDEEKHRYLVEGEEYPSVTTIIGLTVAKDLSWWGMEVGVAGVATLIQRKKFPRPYNPATVVELLKSENLTTRSIFWKRGESGTYIHKAFDAYGKTGKIPELDDFPTEDHVRVQNLCAWLIDNRPEFLEQEVRTASLEHRYAGTFDARIKFHAGEYKGKECLVDLKTGKYVYPDSQFPQLEAYEYAEIESGQRPTDYRLVLHLPAIGPATLTASMDTIGDFVVLLRHYDSIMARRERMKLWKAERKKLTGVNTGEMYGYIK